MAIGWPEAIDGAPRRGLTAKEGFLVSRGMAAQPAGEESSTPLLRHRRSRPQPSFGQIRPLKRPLGAVETRTQNGDDGGHPAARSQRRYGTIWRLHPRTGYSCYILAIAAIGGIATSARRTPAPMQPFPERFNEDRARGLGSGLTPRFQPHPPRTTEALVPTRI